MTAQIKRSAARPFFLVGITGGYGAGKSTLSRLIGLHHTVIDSDQLARQLMETDAGLRCDITKAFGSGVYAPDGALNRLNLADVVFHDEVKRMLLNEIVHPVVMRRIFEIAGSEAAQGRNIVFVESALIYEARIEHLFDFIVVVAADETNVIRRLIEKRSESEQGIRARLESQHSPSEKIRRADFVVRNDSGPENLERASVLLLSIITSLASRNESR